MAHITQKSPPTGVKVSWSNSGDVVSPVASPSSFYLVCQEFEHPRVDTQGSVHSFLVDLSTGRRATDSVMQRFNENGGFIIREHELIIS